MIALRQALVVVWACLAISACQRTLVIQAIPTQASSTFTPALPTVTPSAIVSPVAATASPAMAQPLLTETPDLGAEDLSAYYDGLVITLDYVGQTIAILVGQGILLRLGEDFDWSVSVEPDGVLTQNRKITPEPGEQGVFIARKKGTAVLSAVGNPVCWAEDPPCLRPSVLFKVTFEIK